MKYAMRLYAVAFCATVALFAELAGASTPSIDVDPETVLGFSMADITSGFTGLVSGQAKPLLALAVAIMLVFLMPKFLKKSVK